MRRATLVSLAALVGCSPSAVEPTAESAQPIVGGAVDRTTTSVVSVHREGATELCTGVVVAPRVVLTAGHCVWAPGRYTVGFGDDGRAPEAQIEVTRVALYPTATSTESDLAGGIDLAALELASDAAVPPMPVRSAPLPGELLGARVDVIGVGRSGLSSPTSSPRARVSTTVSRVCSRLLRLGDGTANACDGDSGGAVLYGGELAALVSFGLGGCNTPSSHTRLDAHRPWLERVLARRFDEACPECVGPDPGCAAPIAQSPEPPSSNGCSLGSDPRTSSAWLVALLVGALLRTSAARREASRRARC